MLCLPSTYGGLFFNLCLVPTRAETMIYGGPNSLVLYQTALIIGQARISTQSVLCFHVFALLSENSDVHKIMGDLTSFVRPGVV